jgi:hypothetical protein
MDFFFLYFLRAYGNNGVFCSQPDDDDEVEEFAFLVSWKGYSRSQDTWVAEDVLREQGYGELVEEFMRVHDEKATQIRCFQLSSENPTVKGEYLDTEEANARENKKKRARSPACVPPEGDDLQEGSCFSFVHANPATDVRSQCRIKLSHGSFRVDRETPKKTKKAVETRRDRNSDISQLRYVSCWF